MNTDAMLAAVKLLEMMAITKTRLGSIRGKFEHLVMQKVSVPCPWSMKGTVMRKLIVGSDDKQRQLIDGVRIIEDEGWVLVAPDRLTAAFNISAESESVVNTQNLIDRYTAIVEESQEE
jgi:mannose-1-phosphate guanylyltransferase/phosphomannomutase